MKKLFKTAKQQFEERFREIEVVATDEYGSNVYYLCEGENHRCVILYDAKDNSTYEEIVYDGTLLDIYEHKDFLKNIANHWLEYNGDSIKKLFDWYANADKDNPPFSIGVIAECASNGSLTSFEDIYEEVPDSHIITAKEQWEEASKNAREIPSHTGCSCKFEENEEGLTFYIYHFDSYESYHFPSFDELRADGYFVSSYIEVVQKLHPEDLSLALKWLNDGEYNMSDLTLWDIKEALEGREDEHIFFTDKKLPPEQPIEKKKFTTEINELKEYMISYIVELYDKGLSLNSDYFLSNAYAINWASGSYYNCANIRCVYFRESDDNGLEFSYECKHDAKGDSSDSQLKDLSIETLDKIIESMY